MKVRRIIIALVAIAGALAAQPVVNSVLNNASYALPGLPNGGIAQGSIFAVFGTGLGGNDLAQQPSYPLQKTLNGTSIKVTVNGTTVDAIPIYTLAKQVGAVLPSNTPVGTGTLTLTYNNQTSAAAPITVVANSFGIFTVNQQGTGPGIVTDANYQVRGLTTSAKPGQAVIIWGTGLGAINRDDALQPASPPVDLTSIPVEVWVGSQKAAISYRGRSGCCAGLDQIVATIPAGITGCHASLAVKIGNVVSNFVTTPIAVNGAACSDPNGPTSGLLKQAEKSGSISIGSVILSRSTTVSTLPPPIGTSTTTTDSGLASFSRYTFQQLNSAQNPFQAYTFGACTVYPFQGQSSITVDPIEPTPLDAGPALSVSGPRGVKQMPKSTLGGLAFYYALLGGGSGPTALPPYLDAGSYTVTGPGGNDIVAFSGNINVAAPLTWTNESSIDIIPRVTGVNVTWTGGAPDATVLISGSSFLAGVLPDGSDAVGGVFTCTSMNTGSFTVPPTVLLSLPPSSTIGAGDFTFATGSLSIGSLQTAPMTVPGVDLATINSLVTSGKSVTYQ
jgi:uncharacterized protein (TIGR03437 family)